jgi:hypothetical protein
MSEQLVEKENSWKELNLEQYLKSKALIISQSLENEKHVCNRRDEFILESFVQCNSEHLWPNQVKNIFTLRLKLRLKNSFELCKFKPGEQLNVSNVFDEEKIEAVMRMISKKNGLENKETVFHEIPLKMIANLVPGVIEVKLVF